MFPIHMPWVLISFFSLSLFIQVCVQPRVRKESSAGNCTRQPRLIQYLPTLNSLHGCLLRLIILWWSSADEGVQRAFTRSIGLGSSYLTFLKWLRACEVKRLFNLDSVLLMLLYLLVLYLKNQVGVFRLLQAISALLRLKGSAATGSILIYYTWTGPWGTGNLLRFPFARNLRGELRAKRYS